MTSAGAIRARTKDHISSVALRLRRDLGVADDWAIDIVSLIEFGLKRLIPNFTFSVVADNRLKAEVLAVARENPPEIIVRESIYRQATEQEPRARWILAHEIGHIILQHSAAPNFRSLTTVDV